MFKKKDSPRNGEKGFFLQIKRNSSMQISRNLRFTTLDCTTRTPVKIKMAGRKFQLLNLLFAKTYSCLVSWALMEFRISLRE